MLSTQEPITSNSFWEEEMMIDTLGLMAYSQESPIQTKKELSLMIFPPSKTSFKLKALDPKKY